MTIWEISGTDVGAPIFRAWCRGVDAKDATQTPKSSEEICDLGLNNLINESHDVFLSLDPAAPWPSQGRPQSPTSDMDAIDAVCTSIARPRPSISADAEPAANDFSGR